MAQLLNLARAARIIGVSREALQKRIKAGELPSFDGMVSLEDIKAAYPETKFEDDLLLERINRIKEEAFTKRLRERALPDKEVLLARLFEQSRELADIRLHLQRYHSVIVGMQNRLDGLGNDKPELRPVAAQLRVWLDARLAEVLETAAPDLLDLADDFLRAVSAHVTLHPSEHEFFVDGADTILDAAIRAGFALNYGCTDGGCGLCKARVTSGQIQSVRPHAYVLSEAEKRMGYALLCCNTAVTDLVVEALEAEQPSDIPLQSIRARVKSMIPLTDKIMQLDLQVQQGQRLRFMAGQRVTLGVGESAEGEYSIASCPCDAQSLQFHVRNNPEDGFAWRVFNTLKVGDWVSLQGPVGRFVLEQNGHQPLLLFACNSGFAPVKSLVEHALARDEAGAIHLCWLATVPGGHYASNLCRAWSDALDDFHYTEVSAENLDVDRLRAALLPAIDVFQNLQEYNVLVSGPLPFLQVMREYLAERGVPDSQMRLEEA
jgi:CDP-4-dehydro-6-deoxyglucose reductase